MMKPAMRRSPWAPTLFILLALILAACSGRTPKGQIKGADATPDAVPEVAGDYVVNGVDPLGSEYSGVLKIERGMVAGQYRLQWIVTGSLQEGDGVLTGNVLRAEWRTSAEQRIRAQGVVTYTVTTAGELHGPRSLAGNPHEGHEAAFPNK